MRIIIFGIAILTFGAAPALASGSASGRKRSL